MCAITDSNPPSITFAVLVKNRKNHIYPVLVLSLFFFCFIAPYRFAPLLNLHFFLKKKFTSFGWLRHILLNTYIW